MVVEELRWSALRRESLSVSRSDINSDRVVLSDWRRVALSHPRHRPWIRTGSVSYTHLTLPTIYSV